ncbi:hypothetical protein PGIGA_G00174770, partial [Pangasianodon gigas]|nr:hypothetical protein [Pangasianodon gigas]
LYSVESTGKIKKHDSHSAPRLVQVREGPVQEEDDCIVHPNARLVCKLDWDVFHSCGTLPSFRLIVKMNSTIPHSWSAGLEEPSADAIRTSSLPSLYFPEHSSHLVCSEGHARAGRLCA